MSSREHGHTVANWTGVTISFVGFVIAAAAWVSYAWALVGVGLIVALAGAIVGWFLAKSGKGQPYNKRGAHDPRLDALKAAAAAAEKRRALAAQAPASHDAPAAMAGSAAHH